MKRTLITLDNLDEVLEYIDTNKFNFDTLKIVKIVNHKHQIISYDVVIEVRNE
jgi:hypothetical protein